MTILHYDTRVFVVLPKLCYGFIIDGKETQIKQGYLNHGEMFFISLKGSNIEELIIDISRENELLSFYFMKCGYINNQFVNNRITVLLRVVAKPLCVN